MNINICVDEVAVISWLIQYSYEVQENDYIIYI